METIGRPRSNQKSFLEPKGRLAGFWIKGGTESRFWLQGGFRVRDVVVRGGNMAKVIVDCNTVSFSLKFRYIATGVRDQVAWQESYTRDFMSM